MHRGCQVVKILLTVAASKNIRNDVCQIISNQLTSVAHSRLPLLNGNYMACEMQLHFHASCLAISLVYMFYTATVSNGHSLGMAYALFATHSMCGFALGGLGTLLIMAEDMFGHLD